MIRQCLNLPFVVLITLLVIACSVCGTLVGCQKEISESLRATREAEALLTKTHGEEVQKVIRDFVLNFSGLEAHKDPNIQAEFATEPFLSSAGYAPMGEAPYKESFWRVTRSVVVDSVRVLEYNSERFKAVACIVLQTDKTTTEGVFVESLPTLEYQNVYVFVRENDTWKLADAFNISLPNAWRDWEYISDESKEIIGELPDWEPCNR